MEIKEKVAHLEGLLQGMEYDLTTKEGKIIAEMLDILKDMAEELEYSRDDIDILFDYADELDEDLGEVESELFDIDGDYGDYDDYYDDDEDDIDDFDLDDDEPGEPLKF